MTPPLAGRLVGREREIQAFRRALEALAKERRGGRLWVAGAPGEGKTRLLDAFRDLAREAGVPFIGGQAEGNHVPYGAFLDIARAILGASDEAAGALAPDERASLGRLLPCLHVEGDRAHMEPEGERIALQAAFAHLILRAVAPSGAVIALDDWDGADPGSVDTLAYLLRNAREIPLLVVGTLGLDVPAPEGERLALAPLSEAEIALVTAEQLGEAEVPAGFAAALARWTAGNPGHLRFGLEHLVRTGALGREGEARRLPGELPDGLAGDYDAMRLAALADLPPEAALLAEALAVAGADADLPLLATLVELPDTARAAALDELADRRMIRRHDERLAFSSGAIGAAVYAGIAPERRAALHARVADALELRSVSAPVDAASQTALARHLLRGGQLDRALSAAFLAVDFNMDIFAVGTAHELLREGLALMNAEPGRHDHWRCAYLGRLAAVERWRGDFAAMGACLDEAIPLAERLRENESLGRLLVLKGAYHIQLMTAASFRTAAAVLQRASKIVATGSLLTQARCRYFLGQAYLYQGQKAEARASFEEAARLAEAANLPFWKAKSLAFVGYLMTQGERAGREQGYRMLEEAAAIQARLGDRYGAAFTAALRGEALVKAMRLAEAEAAFEDQVTSNEELGVVEDLATGLTNLASVQALAGRCGAAIATSERAVELADGAHQPVGQLARAILGWSLAVRGELRRAEVALAAAEGMEGGQESYMFTHCVPFLLAGWLKLGRLDVVRRLGQEALFAFRSSPDADLQAQVWALVGEAHARLGEFDTGQDYAERAWQAVGEGGFPFARYLALRLRGLLSLGAGHADAARDAAEAALALAQEAGAEGLAAAASQLLGEALIACGVPGAGPRFRAVQAYADREGVPYMRAIARYGQSLVEPAAGHAESLASEARETLTAIAADLDPPARAAFFALREAANVFGERIVPAAPLGKVTGGLERGELDLAATAGRAKALQALVHRLVALRAPGEVAEQVVATALALAGAEGGMLVVAEGEGFVCRAALGPTGAVPPGVVPVEGCRRALDTRQPLSLLGAADGAEPGHVDPVALRARLWVPLVAAGRAFGVLYLEAPAAATTFAADAVAAAVAVAEHGAAAVALAEHTAPLGTR